MAIPRVEKEKEEKSFLEKILHSKLDTQKLDEAWQSYRYMEKYGIAKYLEERDKLKDKARTKSKEIISVFFSSNGLIFVSKFSSFSLLNSAICS